MTTAIPYDREPDVEAPRILTDTDPGDETPDGDGDVGERGPVRPMNRDGYARLLRDLRESAGGAA